LRYLRFVQDEKPDEDGAWRGYFLAVLLFLVNVVQLLVLQQYWTRCYQAGMEMRAAAIGAIYNKSLRLSNDARRAYTLGQIVNLVTSDANTLQVRYSVSSPLLADVFYLFNGAL
jgi:hypothetical protein